MFGWLHGWLARRRPEAADAGARGEQRAAEWLQRERGFRILARNWRSPADRRRELDIVARDGPVLVFIEVKARPAAALVPGYFAAVQRRKRRVLLRAARDYVARLREKPRTVRFDVVEVATPATGGPPEVRHYANVPLFPKEFRRGR